MTDVAARREARMRRILDNLDNRLKKITNINTPDSNKDEPGEVREPPRVKPPPVHFNHSEDYEVTEPLQPKPEFTTPVPPQPREQEQETPTVYNYRVVIIILLGIGVRYLNLIFDQFEYLIGVDLAFMRIEKVFVPMLVYELTEVLFFKPFVEESGAFNLLLSLNNVNPNKFKKVFRVVNFMLGVLKDMSIYFFAFAIIDLLFAIVDV